MASKQTRYPRLAALSIDTSKPSSGAVSARPHGHAGRHQRPAPLCYPL